MAANAQKIKGAKGQEEYDKYMEIGRELTAKLKELNKEAGV
jgi:hypothetical protein